MAEILTDPDVAPSRDPGRLAADLCRALLTPRDEQEMARLLAEAELTYRDIHEGTGVSTTTIVRVARFLRQEPYQGYRTAMTRLAMEQAS